MGKSLLPPSFVLRTLRVAISAVLTICLIVTFTLFPIINAMTAALLLALEIACLSRWGRWEAISGAVIGAAGLEHYFLAPRGFGLNRPDQVLALAAFLATAVVISQITSRMRQNHREAAERRAEMEKILRLGNAILDSENAGATFEMLPDYMVEIFGAKGAALYDEPSGRVFRSGSKAGAIADEKLRAAATAAESWKDAQTPVVVVPIRRGGQLAGSLGLAGCSLSGRLLDQVAERVSVGLAKVCAAEEEMVVEVARRTDELKTAVLDALIHEIKSPLAGMKLAATTLLSDHPGTPTDQRSMLTALRSEMDRFNERIDEVVRMAQIEAGAPVLDRRPHNLAEIVNRCLGEMELAFQDRLVETEFSAGSTPVDCDAILIKRVFKILLDNAAKYSPPGSPVCVQVSGVSGMTAVSVISEGDALGERERQLVFEKYYRGGGALASGLSGTGLGLWSAKLIVEAHHGTIRATTAPGRNVFEFSLPAAERPMEMEAGRLAPKGPQVETSGTEQQHSFGAI